MSDSSPSPGLVQQYGQALLIRHVEQTLLNLFAKGELFGTVHTCIGQEWTGVALAATARPGDVWFSNHRCHGHYLARTDDVDGLVAEIMGRQTGVCGGRGGSQHLCREGFFSNGVQGGMTPVAAGCALALDRAGQGGIAVAFIGDGTLGEGVLYETLNIASKWRLPLLIVLENNRYAQSTSQTQTLAGDIEARARAFGMAAARTSTEDPSALLAAAASAVEQVRAGDGPFFLCVDTYRLMAHSKGDDNRDPAEVRAHWERDPLTVFQKAFPADAARLQAECEDRVRQAVARSHQAPFAMAEASVTKPARTGWQPVELPEMDRVVNRIHDALQRGLRRDERTILLGEDIEGAYGGAFKVTKNLSGEFPGRVRNMPISEAAIVGLGNGLALAGWRPVCEIMFGDFLTLAADQIINHAAKFRYMYNGQVKVPLVIRTPMGGRRGYGATHSQSLEKHFLGLPGVQVVALHHRHDPSATYDAVLAHEEGATLVIENKLLYGLRVGGPAPDGFVWERTDDALPTVRLRPLGTVPDLTIVCYGGMLPEVEAAVERLFDEHELVAEIVCPLRLYPLDLEPIAESVRASRRLLLVEEGLGFAAFGSEVAAQLLEHAPGVLGALARVAAPEHPIPSAGPLEKQLLPGASQVMRAARELAGKPIIALR